MRIGISMVIVIAVLALGAIAFAAANKDDAPRCDNCGMFLDKSATQAHATFTIDKQEHVNQFVCLGCIYEYAAEHYDGALPTQVQVLDYATFGTDKPAQLDASKAWFLYGTSKLAGSMLPYVAAFATQEAAKAQQPALGGELLQFPDVQARILKALADEDGAVGGEHTMASMGDGETVYVCSCTGGCCDDVRSDKPGTCPQCGMALVPEKK